MTRNILIVFSIMLPCGTAAAQGVLIDGKLDCGDWVEARNSQRSQIYEGVLVGLLNGMALGSGVEIWEGRGIRMSRTQAFLWMDNYCRTNPLNVVTAGAVALANEKSNGAYRRAVSK